MGTPTAAAFFAELRRLGVAYHDHTSGSTYLGSFTAKAITLHDSVTGGMSDETAVGFCKQGRSDVRGPLYGALMGKDGVLHVLTVGRSNNTGSCNGARAAMAQAGKMPLTGELGSPPGDTYNSANTYHYGFAYITYGAGPYTTAQVTQMPKALAAYARAAGWSPTGGASSIIAHGEATNRKSDPKLDMGATRRSVKSYIESGTSKPPAPPPPPPPGDDMPFTTAQLEKIAADGAMRALQGYVLGESNLQTPEAELAYINDPGKQFGTLGKLHQAGAKMFRIVVLKSVNPEVSFPDQYAFGHGMITHIHSVVALQGLIATGVVTPTPAQKCTPAQFDAMREELERWGFDTDCDCDSETCRLDNGQEAPPREEGPSQQEFEMAMVRVSDVDLIEDDEDNPDPSGHRPE